MPVTIFFLAVLSAVLVSNNKVNVYVKRSLVKEASPTHLTT